MKNIVGNDAKIYHYIENVVMAVKNYYGYEDIKRPNSFQEIQKYYQDNIKSGIKKYTFLDNNTFGFMTIGVDSVYQDAEVISMLYRIIEELRVEDLAVNISVSKNYKLDKLKEYLEYLDVDYEVISDNASGLLHYEIVNENVVLASGDKNENELLGSLNIESLIELLSKIFTDRELDVLSQVYIVGESEEERIAAMKLAQDLRWCEIIVKTDVSNKSKDEQLSEAKNGHYNFIIMMEQDNLSKGLIKVVDHYTNEEQMVDEAEIIDYIVSNL